MLDIKFIRENPDTVKKGVKDKGLEVDVDRCDHCGNRFKGLFSP